MSQPYQMTPDHYHPHTWEYTICMLNDISLLFFAHESLFILYPRLSKKKKKLTIFLKNFPQMLLTSYLLIFSSKIILG